MQYGTEVEVQNFVIEQEPNCWGFNSYEYTLQYETEEEEEDEY